MLLLTFYHGWESGRLLSVADMAANHVFLELPAGQSDLPNEISASTFPHFCGYPQFLFSLEICAFGFLKDTIGKEKFV